MMKEIERFPLADESDSEHMLGEEPYIHPSCRIRSSRIGAWVALGENTWLVESEVGDYTYTAGHVQIIYSQIGKFCSIANAVRINPGNHPQWRVTQHHMTYRRKQYGFSGEDDDAFFGWRKEHLCVIGHDVWIGHGAVILPGVHIGTGAVIGAGAVVSRDISPYEVAVGVPAKVIRKRFEDPVIERILSTQWWNWDRATLENHFSDLLFTEEFIRKHA